MPPFTPQHITEGHLAAVSASEGLRRSLWTGVTYGGRGDVRGGGHVSKQLQLVDILQSKGGGAWWMSVAMTPLQGVSVGGLITARTSDSSWVPCAVWGGGSVH